MLCSGKVYYDLLQERRAKAIEDVAIVRAGAALSVPGQSPWAESSRPTPTPTWCGARRSRRTWARGASSTAASRRCWAASTSRSARPVYVGREAAASPATGLAKTHMAEQARW